MSLGVHVKKVFALSWAIAAMVAGMSGIVLGIINGINVHEISSIGLKVFPVVILGRTRQHRRGHHRRHHHRPAGDLHERVYHRAARDVIPYIVLVVILLIKPYGLFGLVEIERV